MLSIKWSTAGSFRTKAGRTAVKALAWTAMIAMLAGCSLLPQEEEPEKLPEIRTPKISQKPEYPVKRGALEQTASGSGKLMSDREENLVFTVDNRRIIDVRVKAGDRVKKDQVLAELDSGDLESQIVRKEIDIEKAELDMKAALRESTTDQDISLRKRQLEYELMKHELAKLREQKAESRLLAPYDGTIVSFTAEKGDFAKAYEKIGRIADLSSLVVAVRFNSGDLKNIAPGMKAKVSLNAAGDLQGTVRRLPVSTDPKDEDTLDAYALIEVGKLPATALHGNPLTAAVTVERRENALYIPPAALRKQNSRNYVLVTNPDGSKGEVDVEIGMQTSTAVEIIKGLEEGQKVVGK
ncbi:efflux RND transporter periplasmic adaptor subunit [Cohnella sp. LGH]|uniref:efflux RND transporter periplasmic adaptor subunit n=1 Tax=Cohnella sp. LGH TaxID=1619153 RepID=UPI001FFE15E4|nr:efflux RND transporter periplasmic adaptor subunit [Cohnella sp. LGH]